MEDSSRKFVDLVKDDLTTYEKILRCAAFAFDQDKPFTDSWLAKKIRWPQRNVLARVRLEVERDGWIERVGKAPGDVLLFRMKPNMRGLLKMVDGESAFMFHEGEL